MSTKETLRTAVIKLRSVEGQLSAAREGMRTAMRAHGEHVAYEQAKAERKEEEEAFERQLDVVLARLDNKVALHELMGTIRDADQDWEQYVVTYKQWRDDLPEYKQYRARMAKLKGYIDALVGCIDECLALGPDQEEMDFMDDADLNLNLDGD